MFVEGGAPSSGPSVVGAHAQAAETNIVLDPQLVATLEFIVASRKLACKAAEAFRALPAIEGVALKIAVDHLENLMLVLDQLILTINDTVVERIAKGVHCRADVLEQSTPRWQHIVNDKEYRPILAKRQLLGHPKRSTLPVIKDQLFDALAAMAQLHTTLGIPSPNVHPKTQEFYEHAEKVRKDADEALDSMAGVSVVEEFGKPEEANVLAPQLLSEWKGQKKPESLLNKLRAFQ